jgi:hypothetical protein
VVIARRLRGGRHGDGRDDDVSVSVNVQLVHEVMEQLVRRA